MKKKVLVLNADFQPLKFTGWKNGLVQTIVKSKESAYVVSFYEEWVVFDTSGRKYQIPAVIALKKYVKLGDKEASYTKTNIFFRDEMRCQYCGDQFPKEDLTVDHVIPRSRWSTLGNKHIKVSSYENIVTACRSCNSMKGSQTCKEAKMYPLNEPVKVTKRAIFVNKLALTDKHPKEWNPYILKT